MKSIKYSCIVGARPNFIKLFPLIRIFNKFKIKYEVIHTGQHKDYEVSDIFFKEFKIKKNIIYLSTHNSSNLLSRLIINIERHLLKSKPDLVIVFGDVTSTMAAAIAAKNLKIKLAHIEAGLRSFDKSMPEEINRIITDHLSDYNFYTEKQAKKNLVKEGIKKNSFFCGNIMIDTLVFFLKKAKQIKINDRLKLKKNYIYLTLHRPENVDDPKKLKKLLIKLNQISKKIKIIFPVHHRTLNVIKKNKLKNLLQNFLILKPQSYLNNLSYILNAKCVLTDSGGIQEEAAYLNIPCCVFRKNTERPVTLNRSNSILCNNINILEKKINKISMIKSNNKIKFWDGKASLRIYSNLKNMMK